MSRPILMGSDSCARGRGRRFEAGFPVMPAPSLNLSRIGSKRAAPCGSGYCPVVGEIHAIVTGLARLAYTYTGCGRRVRSNRAPGQPRSGQAVL